MESLTFEGGFVLVLVAVVFFGFIREKLPPDVVALAAVGILLIAGILNTKDVLGVFSNSAPITVAAMFVLSAALERTGVIDGMGRLVSRAAKWSPTAALLAMMSCVMVMSAFINFDAGRYQFGGVHAVAAVEAVDTAVVRQHLRRDDDTYRNVDEHSC